MQRAGQNFPFGNAGVSTPTKQECSSPAGRSTQGRGTLHSTTCPSSPRNGGVEASKRWAGGSKKVPPSKIPGKSIGKENKDGGQNTRGSGGQSPKLGTTSRARVLKPVKRAVPFHHVPTKGLSIPKPTISNHSRSAANLPSKDPGSSISPNMVSSRRVPDLHSKILSKIRAKRIKGRSAQRVEQCSPSPVPVEEVQRYLDSVFNHCDTYNTGSVRSGNLMRYLTSLVELPQLDKWRIDELGRLLDPRADNRYVDRSVWMSVGRSWVDMMLDMTSIDNEDASAIGGNEVPGSNTGLEGVFVTAEKDHMECLNSSFGSIEGYGEGGEDRCEDRGEEVSLELQVARLQHQVSRFSLERAKLEQSLVISEEQIVALSETIQQLESESAGRRRVEVSEAAICEDEQSERMEELEEKSMLQMKEVRRLEMLLAEAQQELRESKIEELASRKEAEAKRQECQYFQEQLSSIRAEEVNTAREIRATSFHEAEQEMLRQEIRRLQQELSMKEEEMTKLVAQPEQHQETSAVACSPRSSNLSSSMIHDVSVDDAIVVATVRPLQITPSRRGPSASSTPQKSLAKEMAALVEGSPWMPSPFCEKTKVLGAQSFRKRLFQLQEGLAEKMRRLLCEQQSWQKRSSGQVMASVNQAFSEFKRELDKLMEDLYEHVPAGVEQVGRSVASNEWKEQIVSEGHMEPLETQVASLVSLLRMANNTLCVLKDRDSPDLSRELDQQEDLSSWQLDLDGIQLVERGQLLAEKLAQSSRQGRAGLAEGAFDSRVDLEELHAQAERSRDLLRLANYNTRMGTSETAQLAQVTSLMMGRAVGCQTDYDLLLPRREVEEQRCTVPGCFCKSSEGFKDWSWMTRGGLSLLLVFILFTFGCGLELEMQQYFPATWHLLRALADDSIAVPEPFIFIAYNPRT